MAIYVERDIQSGNEGDIVVGENGDLVVAESTDSVRQLLKMVIATDLNELAMSQNFGANLGSLIGKNMDEALDRIQSMVRDGIRRSEYIYAGDVFVDVYPIDFDKIMMFVDLRGTFINSLGQEVFNTNGTMKFYFPYAKERIMEWT